MKEEIKKLKGAFEAYRNNFDYTHDKIENVHLSIELEQACCEARTIATLPIELENNVGLTSEMLWAMNIEEVNPAVARLIMDKWGYKGKSYQEAKADFIQKDKVAKADYDKVCSAMDKFFATVDDEDREDTIEWLKEAFIEYRDSYNTRNKSLKNWTIGQNLTKALEEAKKYINIPIDAFAIIYCTEELWDNEDWWIDEHDDADPMKCIWKMAHSSSFRGDINVAKEAFLNADTQSDKNKIAICQAIASVFNR